MKKRIKFNISRNRKEKLSDNFIANRGIKLTETKSIDEMAEMEQVMAQLNAIAGQLVALSQKQNEHDQVLTYLNQKTEAQTQPPPVTSNENRSNLDLFRIPDPIKSIPSFDGNRRQVNSWLKTAEETLQMFEPLVPTQQYRMYIQAVKNKVEGKARDILCLAGDPETFLEMKEILIEALGDKQELSYYKSQLWANKQIENMSVHSYHNKTKEIVQNIKTLAKQNSIYNNSWQAISTFIEEDALAAFISGLRKPYFGFAQAAKPKTLEEAYAFLCKFSTNESISNNSRKPILTNQYTPKTNQMAPNQPKFNQFIPKPKDVKEFNYRKPNGPTQDTETPMSIDISSRSRNTLNRRIINNHETTQSNEESSEILNSENLEDIENPYPENFQSDPSSDTED